MSMSLMTLAMKAKVGNPLRKLVLIKLADNANDSGECWPSYQYIADDCEIDKSTVRKHIKALEKDGFLKIENRKGPKGNTSNLYVLSLHPVGRNSTPVGPESTPPVGPESTRTYHSSEPVNEPDICQIAVDEYNTMAEECGLSKAQVISPTRKTKLKARLKDCGGIEGWSAALDKIRGSPFLLGHTGDWKASFDFLLQQSSFIKLMEGAYDRSNANQDHGYRGPGANQSGFDGLLEAAAEYHSRHNG
ncbi:helix-turn-helix domain-containing protein [Thalassospira lohafexi]|uniref:Helix-turn-helix domain-containing protein n=1 Tax=Thalassospira lohafexi TaxID=744227 RepID=A0A2N3L0L6_9PROT|nr:helix-turn-helix domain-containing protein [Thalassospira lohafexi]PKR56365.1 hypothetical protein COO92_21405 [Thalassospira lohafexi]